ncbi:hypothetical protein HanRHA438_Chr11g0524011 [Helianthus annuus]|nr:hypothetical protein HanRHA438_Chr11g0524011 [Helianthus annuus]
MGSPLIFLWVHFGFLHIISIKISKRNGFLGTRKDLCRSAPVYFYQIIKILHNKKILYETRYDRT